MWSKATRLLPSFGIAHRGDALAVIVCVLTFQMTNPSPGVLDNRLSLEDECQAADLEPPMMRPEPIIAALVRLPRDDAFTLTPDPLYALVSYSRLRLRLGEASGAPQGPST